MHKTHLLCIPSRHRKNVTSLIEVECKRTEGASRTFQLKEEFVANRRKDRVGGSSRRRKRRRSCSFIAVILEFVNGVVLGGGGGQG
ncbi:hypothetical protein ZHAS_00004300 [Anopheles sinensis]|uniref:Uncharacterized protein n=1 Tax=Anopheles sinensis TaxID=74873 RepID=A0A084VGK1_ANOSI|nr:hypothetical protein ZHAS_00004300 [Anopheles sinensis]